MKWLDERTRKRALIVIILSVSAWGVAQLLLRNLYRFLTFNPQFYAIFAQLQDARMDSPLLLLLVVAFLYSLLAVWLCGRSRWGCVAAILLGTLVWALLVSVAMYATKVNGILFGDVLVSLLNVLQKGGLG